MYSYTLYGLTLATPVRFKTPLFPALSSSPIDLTLSTASRPLWTTAEWEAAEAISYAGGFDLALRISGESYWFALFDEASEAGGERKISQWAIEGNQLRCFLAPTAKPASLEYLLFEIILPKYLQLRGMALFHAAVVEVDGRAILLTAPTGTGKSTLSLMLSKVGARFMADDLAVTREIDGVYEVASAYPKSRLREDSVTRLGVPSRADTPKHVIEGYDWAAFRTTAAPLGGIYVLNRSGPDTEIQIAPLTGHRGLTRLIFDMQNDTPFPLPDIQTQQRDATFVRRLMQRVPARLLTYPGNYKRLDEVAACLLADLHMHCPKPA